MEDTLGAQSGAELPSQTLEAGEDELPVDAEPSHDPAPAPAAQPAEARDEPSAQRVEPNAVDAEDTVVADDGQVGRAEPGEELAAHDDKQNAEDKPEQDAEESAGLGDLGHSTRELGESFDEQRWAGRENRRSFDPTGSPDTAAAVSALARKLKVSLPKEQPAPAEALTFTSWWVEKSTKRVVQISLNVASERFRIILDKEVHFLSSDLLYTHRTESFLATVQQDTKVLECHLHEKFSDNQHALSLELPHLQVQPTPRATAVGSRATAFGPCARARVSVYPSARARALARLGTLEMSGTADSTPATVSAPPRPRAVLGLARGRQAQFVRQADLAHVMRPADWSVARVPC
jgi:hypothetical protein